VTHGTLKHRFAHNAECDTGASEHGAHTPVIIENKDENVI